MRDTRLRKFFWPAIYQVNQNAIVPLPSGAYIKNTQVTYDELNSSERKTSVTVNSEEDVSDATELVGSYVLDPRAIPVAARYLDVLNHNTFDNVAPGIVPNRLVITEEGLYVGPLKSHSGAWITNHHTNPTARSSRMDQTEGSPDDPINFVMTPYDLAQAFKDCNGDKIKIYDDAQPKDYLVTCGILEAKLQEAQSIVNMMFNQFKQTINDKYDGSGAQTELAPGGFDAGIDQSQDQHIPVTVRIGAHSPSGGSGTDEDKQQVPLFSMEKNGVNNGEIIAIDVFKSTGGQKVYQGTYYRKAEGPGWLTTPAQFKLEELAQEGFLGDVIKDRHFVVRKLRSGEAANNAKPMQYVATVAP